MDVVIDSVVRSSGGKKNGLTEIELKRVILRKDEAKEDKKEHAGCWCTLCPSLRHKMTTPSTDSERVAFMKNRIEEIALCKRSCFISTEERVFHALGRAHINVMKRHRDRFNKWIEKVINSSQILSKMDDARESRRTEYSRRRSLIQAGFLHSAKTSAGVSGKIVEDETLRLFKDEDDELLNKLYGGLVLTDEQKKTVGFDAVYLKARSSVQYELKTPVKLIAYQPLQNRKAHFRNVKNVDILTQELKTIQKDKIKRQLGGFNFNKALEKEKERMAQCEGRMQDFFNRLSDVKGGILEPRKLNVLWEESEDNEIDNNE